MWGGRECKGGSPTVEVRMSMQERPKCANLQIFRTTLFRIRGLACELIDHKLDKSICHVDLT